MVQKHLNKGPIVLLVLSLFFLILLIIFFPNSFSQIYTVLTSFNAQIIAEYLRSFGLWAIAVSLILNIMQTMIAFLPSVFLSGANAAVFGLFWGGVISWTGEVVGAAIAFLFYRYLGRPSAYNFIHQPHAKFSKIGLDLKALDDWTGQKGFKVVLLSRLAPFIPSGLINLLAGISSISFVPFLTATALGKAPSLVLETFIGHDIIFFSTYKTRLVWLLALVLILYGVIKYWSDRE